MFFLVDPDPEIRVTLEVRIRIQSNSGRSHNPVKQYEIRVAYSGLETFNPDPRKKKRTDPNPA